MRPHKLNALSCCSFQKSRLRAIQKNSKLRRLVASKRDQIKQTVSIFPTGPSIFYQIRRNINIYVYAYRFIFFNLVTILTIYFFIMRINYNHVADYNAHQMSAFSLLGGEGSKQRTEHGKVITTQICNDIRLN